jgi:glycosyltransferase involved in cell wall biosynthesis
MEINKAHSAGLVVGIDATNLRRGGGVTHLIELLTAAEPEKHGIARVVVWGGAQTLAKLPSRSWIETINPAALNRGLLRRTWWQRFCLSRATHMAQCDVLFVPGGSYVGHFRPIVTMSRNLLPFEWQELRRYGGSLTMLKLLVLRYTQSISYRGADGVIFLTEYARQAVQAVTGSLAGKTTTIPHGLNTRFQIKPKVQRPINEYTKSNPYRMLYVSIIDQYKHQWHVVEAVYALRAEGLSIVLELVGPAYPPALTRLQAVIARLDPEGRWVLYHGAVPYEALDQIYAQADLGVFAASCENMPNILLETMAAGLPVACSNRGPMPEVLGDAGVFFDPESPVDIARALREMIDSPALRARLAKASSERVQAFSWQRCASETFGFLSEVASTYRLKSQNEIVCLSQDRMGKDGGDENTSIGR